MIVNVVINMHFLLPIKSVGKSKKKRVFGILVFGSSFQYLSSIFFESFSLLFFISKHFILSHLSYHLYPFYRIFVFGEKISLWFVETTKCVILFALCYPSCVGVIVEEFWFCWYPSKCRGDWGWSFSFVPYPSSERWLLFGFVLIPLVCDCVGFVFIPLLRCWSCVA